MLMPACVLALSVLASDPMPAKHVRLDEWDKAEQLSKNFLYDVAKLRELNVSELRRLVTSLCDAEEADRESVARDAADRVRTEVSNNIDRLQRLRDEAREALKVVLAADKFRDRWDQARTYRQDVEAKWETADRMTSGARGSNNPVTSFILKAGKEAHDAYQRNSSYCTVYEWSINNGRADCINASRCEVIELKPNNSRAVSKGESQARDYVDALNNDPALRARLVKDGSSNFKDCTRFSAHVALYTLCPEISDDGEMRSTSVGWTQRD